jgi:cytidylate kinase
MDTTKKFVIAINRECGTGGHTIATELAKRLSIKLYDREALAQIKEKYGLTHQELEDIKAKEPNWWDDFCQFYKSFTTFDLKSESKDITSREVFYEESRTLKLLAEQESCIVVGRSGFQVFKDHPNKFSIFIHSNKADRIQHIRNKYHLNEQEAWELIVKLDESRENYTKTFSGTSRYDLRNYDMTINISGMKDEDVVNLLTKCIFK